MANILQKTISYASLDLNELMAQYFSRALPAARISEVSLYLQIFVE